MGIKKGGRHRGVTLNQAHHEIIRVSGSYESGWTALVGIYADKQARQGGEEPISQYNVSAPNQAGVHPYSLIYEAMKASGPGQGGTDD